MRNTLRKTQKETQKKTLRRTLKRIWRRIELSLPIRAVLGRSLRTIEVRVGYLR